MRIPLLGGLGMEARFRMLVRAWIYVPNWVVLRRVGAGTESTVTGERDMLELRPDPAELARMRQFIRRRALEHGLDDSEAFQAQLVATEAVTNAMRHGTPSGGKPISVTCVWRADGLTIEVGDRGRFERRNSAQADPDATSGRGLGLIERLTRRFELETSDRGTTVRMLVGAGDGIAA
jgi:serine/threonine-protein kinase RsbW